MGLAERLHKKGWTQTEIDHALHHLAKAESAKSMYRRVFEEGLYWFAMLLLAAGVIAVVRFLIPFIDASSRTLGWPVSVSYTLVGILGVVVGVLFAHLLHDIAELEPRHHSIVLFFAALTVALAALAVGQYSIPLSATFATVFVIYYSVVWWNRV
jgi:hypothetical protein